MDIDPKQAAAANPIKIVPSQQKEIPVRPFICHSSVQRRLDAPTFETYRPKNAPPAGDLHPHPVQRR